jgi:hypothetical protein
MLPDGQRQTYSSETWQNHMNIVDRELIDALILGAT